MTPLFTLPLMLGAMPKPTSIVHGESVAGLCARAAIGCTQRATTAIEPIASRRRWRIQILLEGGDTHDMSCASRENWPVGESEGTRRAAGRQLVDSVHARLIAATSSSPAVDFRKKPDAPAARACPSIASSSMPVITLTRARGSGLVIARHDSM